MTSIAEKNKPSDFRETTETCDLVLSYNKGTSCVNKSYQIGALNFENIGSEFVIAIVENVSTEIDNEYEDSISISVCDYDTTDVLNFS